MDVSGLVGGGGQVDWQDAINKLMTQALAAQQSDPNAARNSGLMAAGLGMLANATKGAAGGIGAGGLLGMEAYNAERMRQQELPQKQLGMASTLMQLQQGMMTQNELARVQAMRNGQPSPMQQTGPQDTPTDTSNYMGDSLAPPGLSLYQQAQQQQMQQPQQGQQGGIAPGQYTPAQVYGMATSFLPQVQTMGMNAAKLQGLEPQNIRPGGSIVKTDASGNQHIALTAPNLGEGMQMQPGGQVNYPPGYLESLAAAKAVTAGAGKLGELPFQPGVMVPTGNKQDPGEKLLMSAAGQIALGNQNTQVANNQNPSPDIIAQLQDMKARGIPASWQPQTGLLVGNAATNYQAPTKTLGLEPGPTAQAVAQQTALMPGQISQKGQEGLNASDAAEFTAVRDAAKAASASNDQLQTIRATMGGPGGILGGSMAPTLMQGLQFLNGLGIPIAPNQFQNTQQVGVYLNGLSMKQIKAMVGSQNISNQDVTAVKAMMPQIWNDPNVMPRILDTISKANDTQIGLFNRMDTHLRENNGSLRGFEYGFTKAAPAPDNLPVNQTALSKAQQAIRQGADPAAVRQRLNESGYSARGL